MLCLSGGGCRATLFHLEALWQLQKFGHLSRGREGGNDRGLASRAASRCA
jgi:hypothetical protein